MKYLTGKQNVALWNRIHEVEIKAKMKLSQVAIIKKKLLSIGAIFEEKIKENDIYFTAPHRDFIKSKECLRIREKNGYLELTYKSPTTKEMDDKKQFWKEEINIPLYCLKKEAEDLLESLGFKKVVEVIKERERFMLGKQKITIDNVKNGGWFIEIENSIINPKDKEKALDENTALLKQLDINDKDIIEEPYRDIVLKKNFKY